MKTHNNVKSYETDDGTLFLSEEQTIWHERASRLFKPGGLSLSLILTWCSDEIDSVVVKSPEAL